MQSLATQLEIPFLPLYRLALVAHCFDKTIETWDDLDSLIRFPHSKLMQIDAN
jgi:hypothetical protein